MDYALLTTSFLAALVPIASKGAEKLAGNVLTDAWNALKKKLIDSGDDDIIAKVEQKGEFGDEQVKAKVQELLANDEHLAMKVATALEARGNGINIGSQNVGNNSVTASYIGKVDM